MLDSRGNSIYFNLSNNFKRGTERYYLPYNWIGIGIKVLGKYDDDDWSVFRSTEEWNEDTTWKCVDCNYESNNFRSFIKLVDSI